jgi:uncharacterized protein YndB with AHSA1/START domain
MSTQPAAAGVCSTSRVLPFTRAGVFEAFADARSLALWWGPQGFANTFEVFEFRPQGRWIFVMHGPDGSDYANQCVFLETSPERVVIQHVCAPYFTLTVTLGDTAEGHTQLNWQQAFDDPQVAASIWHIIEPANEQNIDRLHHVLASRAN